MKYNSIVIFIFCVTFLSCNEKNSKNKREEFKDALAAISSSLDNVEISKDLITIHVTDSNFNRSKAFLLSDIIDSVWYVPLETTKESLFRRVSKIVKYKDYFYILDTKSKVLLKFTSAGKFVRPIGHVGKGPGEFINPISFNIDEDLGEILLHDERQSKIIHYSLNGDLIKEENLKYRFNEFSKLGENYIISVDRRFNFHLDQIKNYKLLFTSLDWKVNKKAIQYDANTEIGLASARRSLTRYKNLLVYNPSFSNSVYHVTDKGIQEKYLIDVGKRNLPDGFDKNLSVRNFLNKYDSEESNVAYIATPVFETDNHLVTILHYNRRYVYFFYSKKTNKLICNPIVKKNLVNMYDLIPPLETFGDVFVGTVEAHKVAKHYEKFKIMEKYFPKEQMDFEKSVKENDNPILTFYTLKSF